MKKSRLTITLPKDLLSDIDAIIDAKDIRNRSHAIEHLIRQSLAPSIQTALILAGGSKAKASIVNQVKNLVTRLKGHQVNQIIICAGYQHQPALKSLVGPSTKLLFEKKPLGTAGAIKSAINRYQLNHPLLVIHGDIKTALDFTKLMAFHQTHNAPVTIALKPKKVKPTHGQVELQGIKITSFKPRPEKQTISLVNTGIYILEPDVLANVSLKKPSMLEQDILPQLAEAGQLAGFPFTQSWSEE